MEDYKKLLTDLYTIYDPERIQQIDYFLEKYKGKEKQFYSRQKENYENRKPISDSQKIIDEALTRIKSRAPESEEKTEAPIPKPSAKPSIQAIEEEKKEFSTHPPAQEKTDTEPVVEESFAGKTESEEKIRTAAEIRRDRAQQDSFLEQSPEPEKQKESVTSSLRETEKEFLFDGNKSEKHAKIAPDKTEIRLNNKYFLSIFGIVLLTITLIVIVYFTFFDKTNNQAKGIVQKPAGMVGEKAANTIPANTTIQKTQVLSEQQDTILKTSGTEKTIPESKPATSSIKAIEKPLLEKETTSQEPDTAKTEAPQVKTTLSFWDKLFSRKKKTEQKIVETETRTPKQNQELITKEENAIVIQQKPIAEKEEIAEEKEEIPLKVSTRIKKGDIELPAYFVACYAVKTEAYALVKVNQLKRKGFDASYYWIPDFVPQGNPYFKVVIGPCKTQKEAYRKLTPVQERAEFDAYILRLK